MSVVAKRPMVDLTKRAPIAPLESGKVSGPENYDPDQKIDVGPRNMEYIRLTDIVELDQVRQQYDPEQIDDLARSMIDDEHALEQARTPEEISKALNLINPLVLNRLTPENFQKYLREHAAHHGKVYEEIVANEDTFVKIAGHKRQRALLRIAEWYHINPDDIFVQSVVHDNISHDEALSIQLRENVHERPPARDEALSIGKFYRSEVRRTGEYPSYASIARRLGFSESKISSALAFDSLPASVQAYAGTAENQKVLPFGVVARMKVLSDAYIKRYMARQELDTQSEELGPHVENSLLIFANKLATKQINGMGTSKLYEVLTAEIQNVLGELKFQTPELFFIGEDTTDKRLNVSSRMLGSQAIAAIELLSKQGRLNIDESARSALFAALTAEAETAADSSNQLAILDDYRSTQTA